VVTYSSTGPRKRFREMIAAHGGGHGWGALPGLAPIRNSCELQGLCCRSCFRVGPRTCGRGITNIPKRLGAFNQGFPFSLLQCKQGGRTRMGGRWRRGIVYAAWAGVMLCSIVFVTMLHPAGDNMFVLVETKWNKVQTYLTTFPVGTIYLPPCLLLKKILLW